KEEFASRISVLRNKANEFDSISQKYYYVRFELNLRKYFGNEVNSYNDYVYCASPFIDHDFLMLFARTMYLGIHYSFNSNDLRLKMMATLLYTDLTRRNYKPLVFYQSSRGYSMHDATTSVGKIKILLKKYLLSKKSSIDGFNTKPTDELFLNYLQDFVKTNNGIPLSLTADLTGAKSPDINSMVYWMNRIESRY
ncbi:MAG: hypothetical protein K8R74_11855, partial [Bacteroidales bacterium]|nr:hypothetical protein [Bacteroidales bacterium]